MSSALLASAPPQVIPLWPGGVPGSEDWTQEEETTLIPPALKVVRNVVRPTVTAYLPEPSAAAGTAVIVCPGGAFHFLSIDLEGTDVARWLNTRGVAAFVLKYRLIRTGDDFPEAVWETLSVREKMGRLMAELRPLILADGQQAVRVVRERATGWGIASDRIGMIGFSAGASVTLSVALEHDAASRPDFSGAIYGGRRNDIPIPSDAPSLFILCADDDAMAAPAATQLYSDWRAAGHSAELHIYSTGGHGFGMRVQGLPSDTWIERFGDWLQVQGWNGRTRCSSKRGSNTFTGRSRAPGTPGWCGARHCITSSCLDYGRSRPWTSDYRSSFPGAASASTPISPSAKRTSPACWRQVWRPHRR